MTYSDIAFYEVLGIGALLAPVLIGAAVGRRPKEDRHRIVKLLGVAAGAAFASTLVVGLAIVALDALAGDRVGPDPFGAGQSTTTGIDRLVRGGLMLIAVLSLLAAAMVVFGSYVLAWTSGFVRDPSSIGRRWSVVTVLLCLGLAGAVEVLAMSICVAAIALQVQELSDQTYLGHVYNMQISEPLAWSAINAVTIVALVTATTCVLLGHEGEAVIVLAFAMAVLPLTILLVGASVLPEASIVYAACTAALASFAAALALGLRQRGHAATAAGRRAVG